MSEEGVSPAEQRGCFPPAHLVPSLVQPWWLFGRKVLRKFLALPIITVNCFLREFIHPGSCGSGRGAQGSLHGGGSHLESFVTGVKPGRFQILQKREFLKSWSSKTLSVLMLMYFALVWIFFLCECGVFLACSTWENKGAKLFEKQRH